MLLPAIVRKAFNPLALISNHVTLLNGLFQSTELSYEGFLTGPDETDYIICCN